MAILNHTLGILLHPDSEWKAIRKEQTTFQQVFISHVPFLALIPCVAAYFGVTQVGWTVGDGQPVLLSAASALSFCALAYVALLAGVFIFGEFINWMSRTYGVKDDSDKRHYEGTALAVYASTPMMLAGVFNAYPELWLVVTTLCLAGAYSVYLVYEGIPILMNLDKERAFMYSSSVITVGLVLMVTTIITTVLIWGMGMGPVFID
ncbi:Yip1 family protein [Agaribacterium haliotis]|uniref:Yip1 family protein n=1 Tax=Agaribacterium haliotis TaxID=2013869 RepID=UPI000BB52D4E|nr:Yip1 family protein [Agaribacterium haliotis]